jgi:hypothetical protein
MREILIDLDVYSAIWAARRSPEANENDVLRRIFFDLKEVKTSISGADVPIVLEQVEIKMNMNYKIRWIDDVLEALRRLGGESDLAAIYKVVSDIRESRGEKSIATLEATVRRSIEEHSSDSDNFGRNASAPNYFAKVGRGRWRLRSNK